MTFSGSVKRYLSLVLIISLLGVLAGTAAACEEFDQWVTPAPTSQPEETTETPTPIPTQTPTPTPTTISTEDIAILTVYEHLLSQADSHQAKAYLASFYATSNEWRANSELFKDGTTIWYVVVDMTDVEEWEERDYWQQASWFVFKDGSVIPSQRLQANALRIEADLQELSLEPDEIPVNGNGE